jgi:hypothetical protein
VSRERVSVSIDHLVVAAASLDDGARWCEATLGVACEPGGRHALMGTHNRLLALDGGTYLEIIAIDPDAPRPARARWFGLDDAALQRSLARDGPRLVHWVARTADLDATRAALLVAGAPDPGAPTAAARGAYRWRITLRDDGLPQTGGALPALIEWARDSAHPAAALPHAGLTLRALHCRGLAAPVVAALGCVGLAASDAAETPALAADLDTPRGPITLVA